MKKPLLLLAVTIFTITIVVLSSLFGDVHVRFTPVRTLTTSLPDRLTNSIVVSSDALQNWVEADYGISLGPQDYTRHSLILSFQRELSGFVMHRGQHPGWYKPTARTADDLNFCTPAFGETETENTIFVYITDRTDIVSDDEYEYTCWD